MVSKLPKHLQGACEPKLLHFSTLFSGGLVVTNGNRSFCQQVILPMYEVDSPSQMSIFHYAAKLQNTGPLFALTCISIIHCSFIHCWAKQAAKYENLILNATQLILRVFIHCRAKQKSILDAGSRSNLHISLGELTFDIGESTSYIGQLIRWQNEQNTYSYKQCWWNSKTITYGSQQKQGCCFSGLICFFFSS